MRLLTFLNRARSNVCSLKSIKQSFFHYFSIWKKKKLILILLCFPTETGYFFQKEISLPLFSRFFSNRKAFSEILSLIFNISRIGASFQPSKFQTFVNDQAVFKFLPKNCTEILTYEVFIPLSLFDGLPDITRPSFKGRLRFSLCSTYLTLCTRRFFAHHDFTRFFSQTFRLLLWFFDARLSSVDATELTTASVDKILSSWVLRWTDINWSVLWRLSKIKTLSHNLSSLKIFETMVSTKILILLEFGTRCLHFAACLP